MKLAVKLLRQSDLTFFEPVFKRLNTSKQKALNLNRAVLVDQFYPGLAEYSQKELPVRLSIWGPDAVDEHRLSRSITKEAKNWRLNGELVHEPDDDGRYGSLRPDDVAVLRFDGSGLPGRVTMVIISARAAADRAMHPALRDLAGGSMRAVSPEELLAAVEPAAADHPVRLIAVSDRDLADLEDAAAGDPAATRRIAARRRVSREELEAARGRAGEIGYEGEKLVDHWFQEQVEAGQLRHVRWTAARNAASPFDFEVEDLDGTRVRVEVKTTVSPGPRPFYMSLAEVAAAAEERRYDLYRVSGITEAGARLRMTEAVGDWAREVLASCDAMPDGVRPQTFLVQEELFSWSAPVHLSAPDEDEEA